MRCRSAGSATVGRPLRVSICCARSPRPCLAPCRCTMSSQVDSTNWNSPVALDVVEAASGWKPLSRAACAIRYPKSTFAARAARRIPPTTVESAPPELLRDTAAAAAAAAADGEPEGSGACGIVIRSENDVLFPSVLNGRFDDPDVNGGLTITGQPLAEEMTALKRFTDFNIH